MTLRVREIRDVKQVSEWVNRMQRGERLRMEGIEYEIHKVTVRKQAGRFQGAYVELVSQAVEIDNTGGKIYQTITYERKGR